MGRCDQFVGLSHKARKFLVNNGCIKPDNTPTFSNLETVNGIFYYTLTFSLDDEKVLLKGYKLKNGQTVYEKVQTSIWSSGPMIFTSLANENGQWIDEDINWSQDEIE